MMAIDKAAPNIWTVGLIDKIAELVGKEIINMYYEELIQSNYDEESIVEQAMERVMGKIKLIMPDDVYDTIYKHKTIDDYLHDLDLCLPREITCEVETFEPYRTDAQRLAEVGMRQSDFI